jgi:long-chain acyl-CoA synthetase
VPPTLRSDIEHPTLASRNLGDLAEGAFERNGDYPSLLFEGRWHRSGELFERSRRVAGGLAALGVAPGDRVVVCMANGPEVSVVYQALWRAGAVVTPATFLLSAPDLRHVISDAEARAVITTADVAVKAREAGAGIDSVPFLISTGEADDGVLALSSLEQAEPLPVIDRQPNDLAALLYTGGTTGRAKGVELTHANLLYTGNVAYRDSYVEGLNRMLMTLPLSHSYGLVVTIAASFSSERPVTVLLRWFDPVAFLELIEQHRIELSGVVPSMVQRLLAEPLERYDLSSLRYVTCGAAPLARTAAAEFERRAPSVSLRQGYGLTETTALISANPVGRGKPGSVGLPIPGTTVAILDDEGCELPPGEPGEVCCRSPGVMRGYWRSPTATTEALRDGWLRTGDVGYLDEEGYLFIVDRKKDLIIRGGFNVYPRDVEDALVEHPAVAAAGVVGRPDEIHGEEVVAFVSPVTPGAVSADELIKWARQRIGGYKYPREVHIVERIPLTAVGKLDRKALRSLVDPRGRSTEATPAAGEDEEEAGQRSWT